MHDFSTDADRVIFLTTMNSKLKGTIQFNFTSLTVTTGAFMTVSGQAQGQILVSAYVSLFARAK